MNSWFLIFLKSRVLSISFTCITLFGASCVTPSEKRLMKSDIAAVQTRLQQIENKMSSQSEQIEQKSSKKAATTNSKLQKMQRDLQLLRGDIDTLRVGVVTGRLPGVVSESGRDDSLAGAIARLEEKIVTMQEEQTKLWEAIEKVGKQSAAARKSKNAKKSSKEKSVDLASLEEAFKAKRFQDIADQGARFLDSEKDVQKKLRGQYLYAESLYKLGLLRESALQWNDFIEAKPAESLAHAKMRMGDCFRHLGDKITARIYYEELIAEFGGSDEATQAQKRLEKLN